MYRNEIKSINIGRKVNNYGQIINKIKITHTNKYIKICKIHEKFANNFTSKTKQKVLNSVKNSRRNNKIEIKIINR